MLAEVFGNSSGERNLCLLKVDIGVCAGNLFALARLPIEAGNPNARSLRVTASAAKDFAIDDGISVNFKQRSERSSILEDMEKLDIEGLCLPRIDLPLIE